MGRKQKYSKEIKLLAIQKYQDGFKSKSELAIELECNIKSIDQWIRNYMSLGESAFNNKPRKQAYTKELKTEVIIKPSSPFLKGIIKVRISIRSIPSQMLDMEGLRTIDI